MKLSILSRSTQVVLKPITIKDPIYKEWILISPEEKNLINSPYFQRLGHISQLTAVALIYPDGKHSRLGHSIGAGYIAGKYMKHLKKTCPWAGISDKHVQIARIAGFLHDIAHGPFSHAFDKAVYSQIYKNKDNSPMLDGGHDCHRMKLIEIPSLADPIRGCGIDPEDIKKVWDARPPDDNTSQEESLNWIINLVVGGPLGADRMDFIQRDAYHTGNLNLASTDPGRIITGSLLRRISGRGLCLCYEYKIMDDIYNTLAGRKAMYNSVYLHEISAAASYVLEQMMIAASNDLRLLERTLNLDEFLWLTDDITGAIMNFPENHKAKILCKKWKTRTLPKLIYEVNLPGDTKVDTKIEEEIEQTYPNYVKTKSRYIMGVDPKKFDEYGIYIIDGFDISETIMTCTETLERMHQPSGKPYRIVRYFDISNLYE